MNTFTNNDAIELLKNRDALGAELESMYKTSEIDYDHYVKIVHLCESYEEQARPIDIVYPLFGDVFDGLIPNISQLREMNPVVSYLYELEHAINHNYLVRLSSVTQAKKYIRELKHFNPFIEFARKYLKMSYADTLRFLKVIV